MNTILELIDSLKEKEGIALTSFNGYRHFHYTYQELYDLASRTAALLDHIGINKKDVVLIWGPNQPEWVAAFLACIIRGAIAVPIDVHNKPDFVEKVQKQTKAKLLITNTPLSQIKSLSLNNLFYALQFPPSQPRECFEKDIVEILYTSGTTGEPKGVALSHKNFCASLLALQMLIKPEKHTVLSVLPLSHIFEQVIGLLLPLQFGARIIYLPSLKPSLLLDSIRKERVTILLLMPRMMELLLVELQCSPLYSFYSLTKTGKLLLAPSLHFIVVGGAPLDNELERAWEKLGFEVLQGYGMTETTALLTCLLPEVHVHNSVGKAVPGVELKVENDEIVVRGDNVFTAYYRNKQKTSAAFSKGWFKTGDMGECDSAGFIYIKGRKKDMIKTSSGFTIYPEDIEAVLKKCSGVRDACVIGIPTRKGEKVHAVLLLENGNPEEVIAEANKQLDEIQKITDYSLWPDRDFPRTPLQKVKKNVVLGIVLGITPKRIAKTQRERLPPLKATIAQLTTKNILPNAQLRDLDFSSLDRVELATRLEQEFLTDVDENELRPETTVADVEKLILKGIREREVHVRRWTRWSIIRLIRVVIQHFLYIVTALLCRRVVKGRENVSGIRGPVIFIANHASHLDTPVLLMSLPFSLREKITPAAWEEYFFEERKEWYWKVYQLFAYNFTTIFWNAFMFPQTKGFRKALRYAGELVDDGWSILVFPEGARTTTGKLLPFKEGIGFLAKELKIPIVPIKLEGLLPILPRGKIIPSPGKVMVKIGKPLSFTTESVVEITKYIEDALKRL